MIRVNTKASKRIAAVMIAALTAFSVMGCSVETSVTKTETTTETTSGTESSFGLQDYEGMYCRTDTDEMEGFQITYTEGYHFNGDGTGVCYAQDVVDFTWNETEIHFADHTESYTMEDGKLTVNGIEFNKIEGNFILPNPCYVDMDNLDNGIFHAYIDNYSIEESDGKTTITAEIFTEETYDIVDINRMAEGDVIYINGILIPVTSVEKNNFGLLLVNGGLEEGGCALAPVDESNCYVYAGMDMEGSYARQGIASLPVSDNVKFIDHSDPTVEKEYTGSEAVAAIKEKVADYPLYNRCCTIMIENNEIIEVNRHYVP